MKKIFITVFVFIIIFQNNIFASLGTIHIYYLTNASVNKTGTTVNEDICLVTTTNWGNFLIELNGSALSDHMINFFSKWQNSNASLNLVFKVDNSVYYHVTELIQTDSPIYPAVGTNFYLLTALGIVDNE